MKKIVALIVGIFLGFAGSVFAATSVSLTKDGLVQYLNYVRDSLVIGGTATSSDERLRVNGKSLLIGEVTAPIYTATSTTASSTLPLLETTQTRIGSLSGVIKAVGGVLRGDATTSDLPEGSNLYYTVLRWANALAGTTTDALKEGTNNLYFTNQRVRDVITTAKGSLTVGTSTAWNDGELVYVKGDGNLNSIATTSVSCSGSTSCTSFTAIGGSPITISSTDTTASSTLLSDGNNWTGYNIFGRATSSTFGLTGIGDGLLKTRSGSVVLATAGTDYTLITATTCTGSDKVSAISASGAVTCSTDQTGGASSGFIVNATGTPGQVAEFSGTNSLRSTTSINVASLNATSSASIAQLTIGSLSGVLRAAAGLISGGASTSDVPEGINQYFTDQRARDSIQGAGFLVSTSSMDTDGSVYFDGTNMVTDPNYTRTAGTLTVDGLTLGSTGIIQLDAGSPNRLVLGDGNVLTTVQTLGGSVLDFDNWTDDAGQAARVDIGNNKRLYFGSYIGTTSIRWDGSTSTFAGGIEATDIRATSLNCSAFGNGGKLVANANGYFQCADDAGGGGGGGTWPWSVLTNYNVSTNSTTSPMWWMGALYASSTVKFGNSTNEGFSWDSTNLRLGIGSTTPGASLVSGGRLIADHLIATSTTATSTVKWRFSVGTSTSNEINFMPDIVGTSTFTSGYGIDLTNGGCFAIGGVCVIDSVNSAASTTILSDGNTWTGLNRFVGGLISLASSTFQSLCLNGDCRTAWPSGGGAAGNISGTTTFIGLVAAFDGTNSVRGTTTAQFDSVDATSTTRASRFETLSIGNGTSSTFAITNALNGLLKTDGSGSVRVATAGTDYQAALGSGTKGQILAYLGTGVPTWTATTTFSTGLTYTNGNVTCDTASASVFGCLTSAFFTAFNNKVSSTSLKSGQLITYDSTSGNISGSTSPSFSTLNATSSITIGTLTGVLRAVSGLVSQASNGTDYTLITSTTCSGTDKVSAISASGAVTCSPDVGGSGAQTPWSSNIDAAGFGLSGLSSITSSSTSATSSIAGIFSIGSTTPFASDLFSVGTSSPIITVNARSGKVGFGATNNSPAKYVFGSGSNPNVNQNINLLVTDPLDARFGASVSDRGVFMKAPVSSGGFAGIFSYDYLTGTPMPINLQEFGGNVGVATSSPGSTFSVSGKTHLNGDTWIGNNVYWDDTNKKLAVGTNTVGVFERIFVRGAMNGTLQLTRCPVLHMGNAAATADSLGSATAMPIICQGAAQLDINTDGGVRVPIVNEYVASGTPAMSEIYAGATAPNNVNEFSTVRTQWFLGSATSSNGDGIAASAFISLPNANVATTSRTFFFGFARPVATSQTTFNALTANDQCMVAASSTENWFMYCDSNGVERGTYLNFATSTNPFRLTITLDQNGFRAFINDSATPAGTIDFANVPRDMLGFSMGVGLTSGTQAGVNNLRIGDLRLFYGR